ncbi:MAG: zf-HC2 domain-containing protein [Thioalkalispiraceae bacterium]|jgi:hypothetical protein
MNCTQAQSQLDEYLDRNLSAIHRHALEQHLNDCSQCRQELERARNIQQALFDLPVPKPSSDFSWRVFAFLHNRKSQRQKSQSQKSQRSHWLAAASGAVVATFALWLAFSPSLQQSAPPVEIVQIQIEPNRIQTVSMVFNSPDAIDGATLRIDLPDNLQLAGAPQRRVIEWKANLKKGNNRLALPLIVTDNRGSRLTTRISHGQKDKIFYVDVTPKIPGQSQLSPSYQITI